jgi:hypothetical protein
VSLRVRKLLLHRGHGGRSRLARAVIPRLAGGPSRCEGRPPGPYVTIRVGGSLDAIVTLTAKTPPSVLVQATWADGGGARGAISVIRPSEAEALFVANVWTDQLADGHEPPQDAGS